MKIQIISKTVRERAKKLSDKDLNDISDDLSEELCRVWDEDGDGKLTMDEAKSMMLDMANA